MLGNRTPHLLLAATLAAALAHPTRGQAGTVRDWLEIAVGAGGFDATMLPGAQFGSALAPLGDIDADGVPDLAVGARMDFDEIDEGAVWILMLNPDGSVKAEQKINSIKGGFAGELGSSSRFGRSLAPLGDLDGNGVTDLAAGVVGAIWILFLNDTGSVIAEQKIDNLNGGFGGTVDGDFAAALCPLGDLNDDGVVDLGVGAPDAGRIWLLFMNSNGTVQSSALIDATSEPGLADTCDLGAALALIRGPDESDPIVIAAGDPDCSPSGSTSGQVRLITIATDGSVIDAELVTTLDLFDEPPAFETDRLGAAVAGAGDIDGDGSPDLFIGAPSQTQLHGAFYMLDGTRHCLQRVGTGEGGFGAILQTNDRFGSALSVIGDVDGDGVQDLAVGSPSRDAPFVNGTGTVWVLLMDGPVGGGFEVPWACPGGGDLADDCWSRCSPPSVEDTIVFDLPGSRTISSVDPFVANRLSFRDGQHVLELDAPIETLSADLFRPSIVIGDTPGAALLELTGGMIIGPHVVLGHEPGGFGIASITGPDSVLLADETLHVGRFGAGDLEIVGGGTVASGQIVMSLSATSAASANVLGAESTLASDGKLTVGQDGFAELLIADGATVVSEDGIIAQNGSSLAAVTVTGAATTWAAAGLDVGMLGNGTLRIESGAHVSCTSYVTIGTFGGFTTLGDDPGIGEVIVNGAESHLGVDGVLFVGFFGNGTLVLSRGGSAAATDGIDIGDGGFGVGLGSVTVRIGSTEDYADAPAFSGGGSGGFMVELIDGHVPALGDVHHLGGAPASLPDLPPDLAWSTSGTMIAVYRTPDIDASGAISVDDLVALLTSWGACAACPEDLNGDGMVAVDDLIFLLLSWSSQGG